MRLSTRTNELPTILLISLSLFVSSAISGFAQSSNSSPLPQAPNAKIIQISPEGYFSEPSIAINPTNSQQVTAVYQTNAAAVHSTDAGEHWTRAEGTVSKSYRVSGDVSVAYDNQGHAILCYIAFDKLGTADYWGHNATRNGIFIHRSLDGGKTWEEHEVVVDSQTTKPGIPFEDKPYIVSDITHSRYAGNLYIGWTEWRLTESVMLFSRSTDGGKTWSKPIDISDHHGLPRDDNGGVEGFTGTVTPDGVLHVVWTNGNQIVYTYSRDGGKTFAPTREIIRTAPAFFKPSDVYRANGFPEIGSDSHGSKNGGKLYVTWSDYRNGDIDIFESYSNDSGRHWSKAVRVNNDPVHDGADQFFQWLAVDGKDRAVNILFYDRRQDSLNRRATVVLARSTDGGKSFINYQWSDSSFNPADAFLGDYTGIAAYDGRVYGVWTEQIAKNPKGRHDTVVKVGMADFNGEAVNSEQRTVNRKQ